MVFTAFVEVVREFEIATEEFVAIVNVRLEE